MFTLFKTMIPKKAELTAGLILKIALMMLVAFAVIYVIARAKGPIPDLIDAIA